MQKGSVVDISRNKKSGVIKGEIIDADAPVYYPFFEHSL
jgi:hypothetical protein